MGHYAHRGKFIPLRTDDLVDALCTSPELTTQEKGQFCKVAELIQATYHFEFHEDLKRARRAYHLFNPDADTVKIRKSHYTNQKECFEEMVTALEHILVAANYKELSLDDLNSLMTQAAPKGLKIQVNHEHYEKILIYRRGKKKISKEQSPPKKWEFWRFREKKETTEEMFQRLLILIKLKREEDVEDFYDYYVETAGETKGEKERRLFREAALGKRSGVSDSVPPKKPGKRKPAVFLKIFKDVPMSALETLFPDVIIQMTLLDKGLILLPLLGGVISVIKKVIPALLVLGAVVAAIVAGEKINWLEFKDKLFPILAAFSVVGIISVKVFSRYKSTKEKHQAKLMRTLYFHNMDNNAGVFNFLVHEAEEEECKEALLAYYFLLAHSKGKKEGLSSEELDDQVEQWIATTFNKKVDFEVSDALRKLREKGLLKEENGRFSVFSLSKTLEHLDMLWDNYFPYNQDSSS